MCIACLRNSALGAQTMPDTLIGHLVVGAGGGGASGISTGEAASALLYADYWWSGSTVTFSVPGAGASWSAYGPGEEPFDAAYAPLSAAQAERFAAAVATWDAVTALTFTRTNDAVQPGQIRVAFTDVDAFQGSNVWGFAQSPAFRGGSANGQAGDIWIDAGKATASFAATGYDFMAVIHELGHAIGLKHPFEGGTTLAAEYDNHRFTVMSYNDNTDDTLVTVEATATGIQTALRAIYPTTPMVLDIAAIQARYGADQATAAGATTYTFAVNQPIMQAIHDAGGIDVIDLTGHTRPSHIDLTPGAYSSIDYYPVAQQIADWAALYPWAQSFLQQQFDKPTTYTFSKNLGIAYSTVIENAVGGSGGDTLAGNGAANNLQGRLGNDSIAGLDGDDYLRGDEGHDQIVGGAGFDDINGNAGNDTGWGGAGADWVVGGKDNDLLLGEDGDDIVYGNLGDDTGQGGAGADLIRGGQQNDSLSGGAGNDWLSGDRGDDTIAGGAGADTFHIFVGSGIDRILDFNLAEGDRIQADAGTTYALRQSGGDAILDLGGGEQVILVGIDVASLPPLPGLPIGGSVLGSVTGGLPGSWLFNF